MAKASPRSTLDSVQALRAIAAILVVLYHTAGTQKFGLAADQTAELASLSGIWDRGYAGVDMFFVISGFILTYVSHSYARNIQTVWRFMYARATRIYPLWWIFAAIMPLYFLTAYGSVLPPDRTVPAESDTVYLVKSMLLWPQTIPPVLDVGWTLIYEVFFYLVFSLFLLLRRSALPALLCIWSAAILIGAHLAQGERTASPILDLITSHLSLEFIAGAFVGLAVRYRLNILPHIFFILGAAGFILAMLFYTDPSPTSALMGRVAVFALPCCALLYGGVMLEQRRTLRIPAWCVALGNWSYALYLAHPIVIIVLRRVSREAEQWLAPTLKPYLIYSEPGLTGNLIFSLGVIGISIWVAGLAHTYLERPLLKMTRRPVQQPGLVAASP